MKLTDDDLWLLYEVTGTFLEEKAAWLSEGRALHSSSLRFFAQAGSLVAFSRYHYPLASVAFFHAIPGLERALKIHYRDEESSLSDLLHAALKDGLICDSRLSQVRSFTKNFSRMVAREVKEKTATRAELLVRLIPRLRNQYFHGTSLLAHPTICL